MAKVRRFAVDSLEDLSVGAELMLSADESRHVRVLRLTAGTEMELLDGSGRVGRAFLVGDSEQGMRVRVVSHEEPRHSTAAMRLVLAVAWPKGKRAAMLVEKSAELGIDELVPVRFERSVVVKDEESEGITRLKRIAAEASKQSGRSNVMTIAPETTFQDFLTRYSRDGMTVLLDPDADQHLVGLVEHLPRHVTQLALVVGPEGGLSSDEIALASRQGIGKVRMAVNVLRIETAAIAAGAICKALLEN